MKQYVIAGHYDEADGTLYWSDDDGWGLVATVFTEEEQQTCRLPLGGRWLLLNDDGES